MGENRFCCLLETEGSAKPVNANKQQTIHALRREPFATYFSFTSNLPIFGLENKSKARCDYVNTLFQSIVLSVLLGAKVWIICDWWKYCIEFFNYYRTKRGLFDVSGSLVVLLFKTTLECYSFICRVIAIYNRSIIRSIIKCANF